MPFSSGMFIPTSVSTIVINLICCAIFLAAFLECAPWLSNFTLTA